MLWYRVKYKIKIIKEIVTRGAVFDLIDIEQVSVIPVRSQEVHNCTSWRIEKTLRGYSEMYYEHCFVQDSEEMKNHQP